MDYLADAILATVIFYDVFSMPLTLVEIFTYLINPGRVAKIPASGIEPLALTDITEQLQRLIQRGQIQERWGFYFLTGRSQLVDLRIRREKIAAQKWKKLRRFGRWFSAVPYVRALWVSGSLAMDNTEPESDFDAMVVTKHGRLYTARVLLSLAASLFGMRRTRGDAEAPDQFCFNHWLTDQSLAIQHQSLFTAQMYVHLKAFINQDLLAQFYLDNRWLYKYVLAGGQADVLARRTVTVRILLWLQQVGEIVLNTRAGDMIEAWCRRWQQQRIRDNPMTYETGGRVIFTDSELEFHPRSFELVALKKYNDAIERAGIHAPEHELDSGLRQ